MMMDSNQEQEFLETQFKSLSRAIDEIQNVVAAFEEHEASLKSFFDPAALEESVEDVSDERDVIHGLITDLLSLDKEE